MNGLGNDTSKGPTIAVRTIFEYLLGRRPAILEIAATPATLGVAALLVLSAGLARNYDQPEFPREYWRLFGPFVASLAICGLLFGVVHGVARLRRLVGPPVTQAFRSFLTLYWMTAPLAWMYGIPFERFLDPLNSTRANLWTLGLVSAWRVALMVRVVSVLYGIRAIAAFPVVMLVADVAAWVALVFSPVPIIHLMGDVDPQTRLVSDVAIGTVVISTWTFPVWLISAAFAATRWRPAWPSEEWRAGQPVGGLYIFAGLSVAVWAMLAIAVP